MISRISLAAIGLGLVLVAGCTNDPCQQPASFATINAQVFKISCKFSACHNAADHMNNLDLETDPYNALVSVTPDNKQAIANGWKRVVPGDDTKSYMYEKITQAALKDPLLGDRMPDTGQSVSADAIQMIQCWINQGAQNN